MKLTQGLKKPYTFSNSTRPGEILEFPVDLVYASYRGSIAHGMYVPPEDPASIDDIDLIGFAIGDRYHYLGLREWGSRGTKEAKIGHYDCVWYELTKAVRLLLAGNPNILATLWVRESERIFVEDVVRPLFDARSLFVGKHVYASFAGYASAQLLKMESRDPAELREYLGVTYEMKKRGIHPTDQVLPADLGDYIDCSKYGDEALRHKYASFIKKDANLGFLGDKRKKLVVEHGFDCKNAAHCIRLLKMAQEFLLTGGMTVYRVEDAQELLDIKNGKWALSDVKTYAEQLFAAVKDARDRSTLPDGPQRDKIEEILVAAIQEGLGFACRLTVV